MRKYSDYNRIYYSQKYKNAKEQHRCVICLKQDERTIKGKIHCVECAQKAKERQKEVYKQNKAYYRAKSAEQYLRNRENNLCTACGKPLLGRTQIRCIECTLEARSKRIIKNLKKLFENS